MMKINYHSSHRNNVARMILLLSTFIGIVLIAGLLFGTVLLDIHPFTQTNSRANNLAAFVLELRLNREVLALCCGGMLATGSAILQGLTRNPMVAPDLTGMTSIGCLLIILCEILHGSSPLMNIMLGIIGSMLGFLLCIYLAKKRQRLMVVLTGITISFTATALIQLLMLKAPDHISDFLQFLNGSLYAASSQTMVMLTGMTLILMPLVFVLGKRFLVFALDEQTSRSIGVPFTAYQTSCFLVASMLIGSSLMGVGNMGFLGIVAPNIARYLCGQRPRYVFALSFLIGGLLYLLADTLGRCLVSPAEIPAGIMTNMITAPIFLYVLFHFYRGQDGWN